ncbi:hypothetical protein [Polaromonas sp. SM01]|nr:hypothetical protein [Polaromonas sp. SM01]MDW5441933.1 hypothetical protein [Polaromonas sp. SM01]
MTHSTTHLPDHGINDPDVQRDQAHGVLGNPAMHAAPEVLQ